MTPSPSSQEEARELKAICPECGSTGAELCVSSIGTPLPAFHDERYLTRPTPDLGDVDELAFAEHLRCKAKATEDIGDSTDFAQAADTIIALRAALDKKD